MDVCTFRPNFVIATVNAQLHMGTILYVNMTSFSGSIVSLRTLMKRIVSDDKQTTLSYASEMAGHRFVFPSYTSPFGCQHHWYYSWGINKRSLSTVSCNETKTLLSEKFPSCTVHHIPGKSGLRDLMSYIEYSSVNMWPKDVVVVGDDYILILEVN